MTAASAAPTDENSAASETAIAMERTMGDTFR
jgi:hypothetical protein